MEPPPRYDLPPVTLTVAPELARLLHRLQQLRNDGALLATIDLRTLELYPALAVERLAPQPKSVLHSG
jgi:hypothetical protein